MALCQVGPDPSFYLTFPPDSRAGPSLGALDRRHERMPRRIVTWRPLEPHGERDHMPCDSLDGTVVPDDAASTPVPRRSGNLIFSLHITTNGRLLRISSKYESGVLTLIETRGASYLRVDSSRDCQRS
jgi:hypothetical protein